MTNPFLTPGTVDSAPSTTEHHKFPLPPEPREFRPTYDNYGRYVLPEVGGKETFTRVTTGAKALDDTYYIDRWKQRNVIHGLKSNPSILDDVDMYQANPADVNRDIDRALEKAQTAAGAHEASELGTAIHAWLEALELGQVDMEDVPEKFIPYVEAYVAQMNKYGIRTAEYQGRPLVERIVYNSHTEWVGTFDRVYELADGSWVIGDVKTTKDIRNGALAISVQLWDYAAADKMLSLDGSTWEPMPEVRQDFAVVAWVPSNDPARSSMVTIDLEAGAVAAETAVRVRNMRSQANKTILNTHTIPRTAPVATPSVGAKAEIRRLIGMAQRAEDIAALWDAYPEQWDDELTQAGMARMAELS